MHAAPQQHPNDDANPRSGSDATSDPDEAEAYQPIDEMGTPAHLVVDFHSHGLTPARRYRRAHAFLPFYEGAARAYPLFILWPSTGLEVFRNALDEWRHDDAIRGGLETAAELLAHLFPHGTRAASPRTERVADLVKETLERGYRPDEWEAWDDFLAQASEATIGQITEVSDAGQFAPMGGLLQTERLSDWLEPRPAPAPITDVPTAVPLPTAERPAQSGTPRGVLTVLGAAFLSLLAVRSAQTLVRVLRRRLAGTDHGFYPTLVEELLRSGGAAGFGGQFWKGMRRSLDISLNRADWPGYGRLDEILRRDSRVTPVLSLVGQGLGCQGLINFLSVLRQRGWLSRFRRPVRAVLIAPVLNFEVLARIMQWSAGEVAWRIYSLSDRLEQQDQLGLYPLSFNYFISSLLERTGDEGLQGDFPLAGMARFYPPDNPRPCRRPVLSDWIGDCINRLRDDGAPTGLIQSDGDRVGLTAARSSEDWDHDHVTWEGIAAWLRREVRP